MKPTRIIGLTGYAGSGKDEVARIMMTSAWFTFIRVAFADPLKEIARDIGWNGEKDEAGRALLQNLGVAVRNRIGPNTWIDTAFRRVESLRADGYDVVITDVRFANEIERIRDEGGEIWRVTRPGCGPVNDHVSEHEWTNYDADRIILNNEGLRGLARRTDDRLRVLSRGARV